MPVNQITSKGTLAGHSLPRRCKSPLVVVVVLVTVVHYTARNGFPKKFGVIADLIRPHIRCGSPIDRQPPLCRLFHQVAWLLCCLSLSICVTQSVHQPIQTPLDWGESKSICDPISYLMLRRRDIEIPRAMF